MAQHSTRQHSTRQHSTAQHSTHQHSTAHDSTAQHTAHISTAHISTAHVSTAQHSTHQHSTAHVSTAQHTTAAWQAKRGQHSSSVPSIQSFPLHCSHLTVTTCVGSSSSKNCRSCEITTTDPSNLRSAAVSTCQRRGRGEEKGGVLR